MGWGILTVVIEDEFVEHPPAWFLADITVDPLRTQLRMRNHVRQHLAEGGKQREYISSLLFGASGEGRAHAANVLEMKGKKGMPGKFYVLSFVF